MANTIPRCPERSRSCTPGNSNDSSLQTRPQVSSYAGKQYKSVRVCTFLRLDGNDLPGRPPRTGALIPASLALNMRIVLRVIAVVTAISVCTTAWFIAWMARTGGLQALFHAGLLGVITFAGWGVTLVLGPITAVQLWRVRETGRRAGIFLYGYGVLYYLFGFGLRSPDSSIDQIISAAGMPALTFVVLLLPRARAATANR